MVGRQVAHDACLDAQYEGKAIHQHCLGNGGSSYVLRQIEKAWEKATLDIPAPVFSEEWLALQFAQRHADDLRYVAQWGQWYRWNGLRWEEDKTRKVFDLSRQICREAATRTNGARTPRTSPRPRPGRRCSVLASDDRRQAATVEQWDADPWLLNTPAALSICGPVRSGRRGPRTT
jgi:hypothetical protein